MKHVMVDLETLGTTADAVILSIGAVRFDLDSDQLDDDGFYSSISIDSSLACGRRIQEDTLLWWLKQTAAAQAVFHEPKVTLATSLCEFSDWLGPTESLLWANGADFDLPMLAHAFRQADMDIPWLFWNSRCVRTFKNLPQARNVKVPRLGTHHNALSDAAYQVRLVQLIQRELLKGVKPSSMVKAST